MEILRIYKTPEDLVKKIKVLAKDNEQTISDFLRPVIKNFAKKYESTKVEDSKLVTLSVTGISEDVINKLKLPAKKIGITVTQLLRLELNEFIENQSDFNKSLF